MKDASLIVIPPDSGRVMAFAASELAKYLSRVVGREFDVVRDTIPPDRALFFKIDPTLERDEYRIKTEPDLCEVTGGSERACLYAVYEILEEVGCRFVLPGEHGEWVPQNPHAVLPVGEIVERPQFEVRALAEDAKHVPADLDEAVELHLQAERDIVDWMAKQRLNRFFTRPPEQILPEILEELEKRGIEYEAGGHFIPQLLPRSLFKEKPELFRMDERGERTSFGNLCPSSEEALNIVAKGVEEFLKANPAVVLYHLWPEDLPGGGWCNCPSCKGLSPSAQYLKVVNHVARHLREAGIEKGIDFLAYHDTLPPPEGAEVEEGVQLTFAPRERCYAHSLDDPRCPKNEEYRKHLEGYLKLFNGRPTLAFEYYGDPVLWGSVGVPAANIVAHDLNYYADLGLKGVQCLVFGPFSFWAYGLNIYAFARLAWDPDFDPDSILLDFLSHLISERVEEFAALLRRWEEAIKPFLTYGDIKTLSEPKAPCLSQPLVEMERGLIALRGLTENPPILPPEEWGKTLVELLNFTADELEAVFEVLSFLTKGKKGKASSALKTFEGSAQRMLELPLKWVGLWGKVGFPRYQNTYVEGLKAVLKGGG